MGETTEGTMQVRCHCGWRLFDIKPGTQGVIKVKCPRCRAVMVITIKDKKYKCTEQIAAHDK